MTDDLFFKVRAAREFFEFDKVELSLLLRVSIDAYRSASSELQRAIADKDRLPHIIMLDRECDARSADITRIIGMIETGGRWA